MAKINVLEDLTPGSPSSRLGEGQPSFSLCLHILECIQTPSAVKGRYHVGWGSRMNSLILPKLSLGEAYLQIRAHSRVLEKGTGLPRRNWSKRTRA